MWSELRRHELPAMLRTVSSLLKLLGLDVDPRNKNGIPILLYVFALFSAASYFYVYQISNYWFIFWRGADSDLLVKITFISLGISSLIAFTKMVYAYIFRDTLKKINAGYLECDLKLKPNSRMSQNVLTTLKTVRKRAVIFWLVIIANGVVYVIKPLLLPGRHLMEENQLLLGLEPLEESPNYEIAFILTTFGVYITVYVPANVTGLLIVIAGYTEAQILALSQELLNLWDDAQENTQKPVDIEEGASTEDTKETDILVNAYIKNRLHKIIEDHAVNINLIGQVEGVFKTVIAIEFGLLSAALIAELLGGLENTYIEVPFALVQVAMDCFTGQRLIDASDAFESAVYSCNWERFDKTNMKLVMIMLQNSQKTLRLSAGGVATLSYGSLMAVFKSIYSAFTALRSTMH